MPALHYGKSGRDTAPDSPGSSKITAKKFALTNNLMSSILKQTVYAMTDDFCNRTATRARKFGYAPKAAIRIARFCYIFMLFLRGLMGPICVPSNVENLLNRGHGINSPGVRASLQLLSFTRQRRSPAL